MYILKNAYKAVIRNIGRNILIGILLLVISIASTISLAILNTSNTLIESYQSKYDIEATIGINRDNMMKDFDPSNRGNRDKLVDNFKDIGNLSISDILLYANSNYVKNYYYTVQIGLDGKSIDPASSQKEGDNSFGAKRFPGKGGMMQSNTDFRLIAYSSLEAMNEFISGKYVIVDGSYLEEEKNCMINSELATLNGISVGDTIKLQDDDNTYLFVVSAIFDDASEEDSMNMFSNSANTIITNINTITFITNKNSDINTTVTPTFILNDKDAISNFESELYDKGLNESLSVNTNLDIIEGSTSVIGNVKSFAVSFLIVVLVIGSIILIVINAINIRERKYEIGVLRTIGMKKVVLTFQFLSELLMVTLVSLVFGILVGSFISVPVSNNLLKSEIESSQKQVDDIIGNFKGENFDFSRVNGINKINEFESIDATVNAYVLVYVLLIGLSLTCVSTLSSMISIQRFKPLTILKERS